jgi:hypothetical protein
MSDLYGTIQQAGDAMMDYISASPVSGINFLWSARGVLFVSRAVTSRAGIIRPFKID